MLTAIPLETGQKQYSAEYRLQTYVKIARLCLEEDDPDTAETYITRAGVLVVSRVRCSFFSLDVVFVCCLWFLDLSPFGPIRPLQGYGI